MAIKCRDNDILLNDYYGIGEYSCNILFHVKYTVKVHSCQAAMTSAVSISIWFDFLVSVAVLHKMVPFFA